MIPHERIKPPDKSSSRPLVHLAQAVRGDRSGVVSLVARMTFNYPHWEDATVASADGAFRDFAQGSAATWAVPCAC